MTKMLFEIKWRGSERKTVKEEERESVTESQEGRRVSDETDRQTD
jgi:hypothetical protein